MAAFKNKDNGTWYVQFRYTDWKGERQQKLKRGFATKREALEWEREFLMEKQADVNMTFESFVALYEKDIKPKLKLNTWLTKESIIKKKILPYFANRKLSEITAKDIIRWQNEIRELRDYHGKPLSKTYLKTVHNQLSAIFNHAARFYGLNINPARQAGNMGAEERKEMLFWTREEYTHGHIPGSQNLPLQEVTRIGTMVPDQSTPLYVHCYSGARSGRAVTALRRMGYSHVSNIGGIRDYRGKTEGGN